MQQYTQKDIYRKYEKNMLQLQTENINNLVKGLL